MKIPSHLSNLLFIIFIGLLSACSSDSATSTAAEDESKDLISDTIEDESSEDALAALNLPNDSFSYANIALPDYYLEDQFPDNFRFTRPVTFFDNTPEENPITNAGATLGRVLFHDKKLSRWIFRSRPA